MAPRTSKPAITVADVLQRRPRTRDRREFVPNKLIVRFKPEALHGAVGAAGRGVRSLRGALPDQVAGPLELLSRDFGMNRIDALLVAPRRSPRAARGARGVSSLAASVERSPRERLAGYSVVEMKADSVPDSVLRRIQSSGAVDFVERVANRWTCKAAETADPSLNLQWGLRAIDWFGARNLPDASEVHVAILDTGVDAGHEDLKGSIEAYHRNGHSQKDLPGHGTHVSGILAARTNNGVGISGVANCRLHVWKVFTDPRRPNVAEEFDDEAYNQSLAAVLDSPATIVNLSLGGSEPSRTERDIIDVLVDEGVLVVAAMGNEYDEGNPTEWPAAYENVLAVGAIGENRRRAPFSNTGRHIGVVAPGNNILSTLPGYAYFDRLETDYDSWPGTSMAAPHVAGCAALLKARYPGRDGSWIHRRLCRTAVKLAAMGKKSFTPSYGHGLVSLKRALGRGRP